MGKTKKLHLANRILAMMLAVAMSVTMIPSTALAAPADDPAVDEIVDVTAEGSGDVVDVDMDDDTDDVNTDVDDTDVDDKDVDDTNTDVDDTNKDVDDTNTDVDDTNKDVDDANKDTDGANSANAKVNAEETAPAASSYKIVWKEGAEYDTKVEYDGRSHFDDLVDKVELQKDGVPVTPAETITATYKKGADGTDVAGAPTEAGSYKVVLTCAAVAGVHEAVTMDPVECEITKAPVKITLTEESRTVKPGTKRSEVPVPVIDRVFEGTESNLNRIDNDQLTLTITKIRDAVTGTEIDANAELKQNGDYVMDLTPAYTTDTTKFQGNDKAAFENNFDLQPFTADIKVADLIQTQVVIKLADKWKTEDQKTNNQPATQITYEYTGEAAAAPAEGADKDYMVEVQYYDEKETDPTKQWKTLTKEVAGDEVTTSGKWIDDFGEEMDAPKDAATYYYKVSYPGKDGVYAANEDLITVEITPKQLTVEPDSTEALEVAENSTVADVLAQIDYKVLDKDGKDVKATVKAAHIWGTGYSDYGKSQIYEPLFTMQQSADGTTWTEIDDSATLQKDMKYRAVFTGRKAVFYTNSEADIADNINSDKTNNNRRINGVDTNYYTDYTFDQAKTKTREVKVKAGTKAVIDVSALVKDGEGAATIEGLKPRQYDGKPIYPSRSAYRNVVKLKGEGADGAAIHTEQREFTYTWERYTGGDWIEAQIELKNGTAVDSLTWSEELDRSGKPIVSPIDAGVYRLTVSYEDKIDPDAYYYADDAVLYFAIDKRQVTITPMKESYEILAGKDSGNFFYGEEEIKYDVKAADGKELPSDYEYFVPHGQIVKKTGAASTEYAVQGTDYDMEFVKADNITYALQGYGLRQRNKSDGSWVLASNYTCESSEPVQNGTTWERKNTPLNTTERPITVVPMGTQALTISADTTKWVAKEKVYDAKPFAEADLVPAGLVSVKKADGTDAAVKLTYNTGIDSYGYFEELKDITEAGTYDLYACFLGDKDYAPFCNEDGSTKNVKLGTFKITKREITLTADMDKNYPAGTAVSDITGAVWNNYQATGYAPGQEEFFSKDWEGNMSAWSGLDFYVTEKDGKRLYDYDCLKRNKTYEVRYDKDASSLDTDYEWDSVNGVSFVPSDDYTVKNAPVAAFETVPGNSEIESVDYEGIAAIQTRVQNDKEDPLKREVKMTEAIPWSTYEFVGSGEGNFVAFQITAPAEYEQMPATAMYENAIKAKGGYVADTDYNSFTAVFDAAKGDTTFAIRWEDGYVETYTLKFDEAVKLPNLEDAVAPKSLAFNAANKTMAVGQGQALDVKITKEQMGDVIYLGYKSENEDILAVNENGYVTALKMGTGTITVFAQHEVKGEPVPIWDAKKGEGTYAKSAKLQIKVTKLDAPKKLKATAHDQSIDLNYDSPAYGYRREIYVMEKEKAGSISCKTPADFDKLLSGMKENQWKAKGFAIAPVYITLGAENSNRNANNYVRRLSGLDIRKEYRIYVRNVCAVRTLSSYYGKVAITQAAMEESASGAVIDVKTKKAEVYRLNASYIWHDNKDGSWVYDEDGNHVLQLSKMKGTVESRPIGGFPAVSPQDELSTDDLVWIDLPFSKEDKTTYGGVYEEPTLEFLLPDCYDKKTDTLGWGTKNDYASIDKKGKIKITGLPEVSYGNVSDLQFIVRDTVTGEYDWGSVPLMAEDADSVTAAKKSVAMSVGQEQNLENLLTYSIGRTKLTAYPNRSLDLAKVREAIRTQNQAEYFELDEWGNLTAIQGGGKLELELTDTNVAKVNADKATAKVTITSKDVDAIKSLKACDVNYNKFGLTFVYPGYDNADGFLLEVYDAKKPIYSKVIDKWDTERVPMTDKEGRYVYKRDAKGSLTDEWSTLYGFTYVKDTYKISAWSIESWMGQRLTKDSQYTVSLTPISHGKKAKAASTKVKTTKIPAVDGYLTNEIYDENYYADNSDVWACNQRGGMEITVSEYASNWKLSENSKTLYAVSGNTYTLTAEVQHNRGRVNDTLVWTVGDSKVATVKAAAGSYCITLNGMKPGTTKLEVRSKLLGNKVIARYDITVSPVQNAKPQYYGENEPE